MKRYYIIMVLSFFLLSIPVYSGPKMRIAVLDLKADGVSARVARTVSDMLRTEFVNIGRFIVVERSQMDAIMREQGLQQTGCTDQECAVKMGKLLSANKILVGSVSPLGKKIIMNLRIVDVEKGVSEFAARDDAKGIDSLDAAVDRITKKLTKRIEESQGINGDDNTSIGKPFIDITLSGAYLVPQGDFGKKLDPGYGGIVSISFKSLQIGNLSFALESGYISLAGKHDKVDSMSIVPVFLNLQYLLNITKSFSLEPKISFGYSYNTLKYDKSNVIGEEEYTTVSEFEPAALAGVLFGYSFSNLFAIRIGASYGAIIESDGLMYLLSINAGAVICF